MRKLAAILSAVTVVVLSIAFLWWWDDKYNWMGQFEEVFAVARGADSQIQILWGAEEINDTVLVYRVTVGRNVEVDDDWFGRCFGVIDGTVRKDAVKFNAIHSIDGRLISIVEEENPDVLLVVHDFGTGLSYPCDLHSGRIDKDSLRPWKDSLIGEMRGSTGISNLLLSCDVPSSRNHQLRVRHP